MRTVRFTARHRYGRRDWDEARNEAVFGPARESHEHDWTLTVSVRGPVDPQSGMVVDLTALDAVLRAEVVERFDGGDLNEAVAPVRAGRMQPSTEALAGWLFQRLAPRIPGDARLVRLRLAESDELASEVEA